MRHQNCNIVRLRHKLERGSFIRDFSIRVIIIYHYLCRYTRDFFHSRIFTSSRVHMFGNRYHDTKILILKQYICLKHVCQGFFIFYLKCVIKIYMRLKIPKFSTKMIIFGDGTILISLVITLFKNSIKTFEIFFI